MSIELSIEEADRQVGGGGHLERNVSCVVVIDECIRSKPKAKIEGQPDPESAMVVANSARSSSVHV